MITNSFSVKKYLILFFALIFSLPNAQKKFTIVLDPGHGGSDIGANRRYEDLGTVREKDITLAVTLKLGRILEKNKDYKVIYTRKIDEFPSLTDRTTLANRSKADLFISIHVNSSAATSSSTAIGTETFIQGPAQNKRNLEVAKAENDVIFLDDRDRQTFATYDPSSPESLIALKIQQSKYLESSLLIGSLVEENFVNKDKRNSRGIKQADLHVLRMNAMPSILVETGFVNNYEDARYLSTEQGQSDIAESIYDAITKYRNAMGRNGKASNQPKEAEKPEEKPLKNDFRILLMSSPMKYTDTDPALKGLSYILTIKENDFYKYFYSVTNFASVRDINLKTARDAGFRNATSISFVPDQKLGIGYYTIEVAVTDQKLSSNSFILNALKGVDRNKQNGKFLYTYGKFASLEEAVKAQKELDNKGIKNTVIQKLSR